LNVCKFGGSHIIEVGGRDEKQSHPNHKSYLWSRGGKLVVWCVQLDIGKIKISCERCLLLFISGVYMAEKSRAHLVEVAVYVCEKKEPLI
jgi:hypothetical protein